jgi:signal transduction histidine kinase
VKTLHVLVVDDDVVDRRALRRAFAGTVVPVEIEEASTAAQVFERLARGGCDCVLLDYGLPGLNGLETLAEIRRRGIDVPVIVLTGKGDERVAVELMKAGAADYLVKQDLTSDRLERSVRHGLAMADLARLRAQLLAYEQGARRAAQAENAAKDEFLATLSHELRTPLNVILGWARLLTGGTVDERDRPRAYDAVERNASALARHIDDLLDVSRIVSGKLDLEMAPLDFPALVNASVDSARPTAAANHIDVEVVFSPIAAPISGDPVRLQQVVTNLLTNSLKFTPPDGHVVVRLAQEGARAVLTVTDSGSGIRPEALPFVFERFRQASIADTKAGGLGLGLAIVKHIVEAHEGTVSAASGGAGQGATFTVTLPLMADARDAAVTVVGRTGGAEPLLAGLRIVVADDQTDSRDLIEFLLTQQGAVVTAAPSAAEAFAAVRSHPPDVLLSDIEMPDETGYSLIARIRALPPEEGGRVPAVAMTAHGSREDKERALAAGFHRHLPKPFHPADLFALIGDLAGREAPVSA